ncbi:hypothetical protein DRN39_04345 [Thermococci archaeon]|nr:MAG: hypothetical protein DRN39_04345 [Thermococci archaeon]
MDRLSLGYLSLIVAAYMIGLSNLWKFPALLLKYGLGGLLFYIVIVITMIPLIAVAMESTKHKRHELLEYYYEEYGKPGLGLTFFVFDVVLLSYYALVGGWPLTALAIKDVTSSFSGNVLTLVIVFVVLLLVLMHGKERTFDIMVISVALAFISFLTAIFLLYIKIGQYNTGDMFLKWLGEAFAWKGISASMIRDMSQQAAYSLSLGMGFYLVLGEFLPNRISSIKLATIGALLDTAASILGTILISMVLAFSPDVPIHGTALVFKGLPQVLKAVNASPVLYLLYFTLFLIALSSMIPLGETIIRVFEELSRRPRQTAAPIILASTFVLGIASVAVMIYGGVDTIGILDGAVTTFVLFGGIIAAWAVITGKEYIPSSLRRASYIGVLIVGTLGIYALIQLILGKNFASLVLLLMLLGVALGFNGYLKGLLSE